MDYESLTDKLKFNIENLSDFIINNQAKNPVLEYMSNIAVENGFEVTGVNDAIYFKRGDKPSAIIHLNLEYKNRNYNLSLDENNPSHLVSTCESTYINAILIISLLVLDQDVNFDILITNNVIQSENKSFKTLANIIRSQNIINLNLNKSFCLADQFSSLILSRINIPVERFEITYDYKKFRISLSNLIGGHTGEDLDKLRLNSIKTLIGFIRKIKSKVDIDITNITAGERYDNIPSGGFIDFVVKSQYENELLDIFEIIKNKYIEKNLKHEPEMDLSIKEIDKIDYLPITQTSFNHLLSFVELIPSGAYKVDNISNELISSINLSTARTFEDLFAFVIVYRSLSEEIMNEMQNKTSIAAEISYGEIITNLFIPKWKNSNDNLVNAFRRAYTNIFNEDLQVIKTQYSLDSSIIFNNLNVNLISLGVEYKQGEDGNYYSKLADIVSETMLINNAITQLEENWGGHVWAKNYKYMVMS